MVVTPPGWYVDPGAGTCWRWWDGTAWTGHIAPMLSAPLPFPGVRAEFNRRALGWVIDALVIVVPCIALFFGVFIAWAVHNTSEGREPDIGGFFALMIPLQLLVFVVPVLYYGLLLADGRQTVGARVAGLRVVDAATGGPLPLGRSFVRALVAAVASGQVGGLGYWWALWDSEHRTWHDMAAHTVVIDVRGTEGAGGGRP